MCHCVELHYCDGKTTIEYGYRIKPDYWENEIYEVEWFNKNMSYDEMFKKLENLFKNYFGEEEFIYKDYQNLEI